MGSICLRMLSECWLWLAIRVLKKQSKWGSESMRLEVIYKSPILLLC